MKIYFKLFESTSLEEIGSFPQVEEAIYNCDPLTDPEFIDNIGNKQIAFIPKMPLGILSSRAKLTDLLSSPAMGFTRKLIISEKIKGILERNNIPDIQLFECRINVGNELVPYWILNPTRFRTDILDFERSEIHLMKGSFTTLEKLNISSNEELQKYQAEVQKLGATHRIRISNIFLKETPCSFFALDKVLGGINYFVSEELKEEFQFNGITGIAYTLPPF